MSTTDGTQWTSWPARTQGVQYGFTMGRSRTAQVSGELAGLAVGDRVADPGWLIPVGVRVEADLAPGGTGERYLIFQPSPMTGPARPTVDLLVRFVRLKDAEEATVLGFAERFGPLYLAFEPYRPMVREIRVPIVGGPPIEALAIEAPVVTPPTEWGSPRLSLGYASTTNFVEPVRLWRQLAGLLESLLMTAARLRMGERAAVANLAILEEVVRFPLRSGFDDAELTANEAATDKGIPVLLEDRESIGGERHLVTLVIESLLGLAGVGPRFYWGSEFTTGPRLKLAGSGLFGALVVRLIASIAGADGLAQCVTCGLLYVPRRRPARGRRHYCDVCREGRQPQRDAEADYRNRIRGLSAPSARLTQDRRETEPLRGGPS